MSAASPEDISCRCDRYAAQPAGFVPLDGSLNDWDEERGGFLRKRDYRWNLPPQEKGEHNRTEAYYACTLCQRRWCVTRTGVFEKDLRRWEEVTERPELDAVFTTAPRAVDACACTAGIEDPHVEPASHTQVTRRFVLGRFLLVYLVCDRCHSRWLVTHDSSEPRRRGVFRWEPAGSSSDDRYFTEVIAFSVAAIERIVGEVAAVILPRNACTICSGFKASSGSFEKGGEVIFNDMPDVARLEKLLSIEDRDGLTVRRCPACGRLYVHRVGYEYLVGGGTEDEATLALVEPAQAIQLFLEALGHFVGIASLVREGAGWSASFQPAP